MEQLIAKYAAKLVAAGMADPDAPLIGGLDAELSWNRDDPAIPALEQVFSRLNINALLLSRPAEPYASMIDYLAARADGAIRPRDSETRTFLHDLPVIDELEPGAVAAALARRKSAIVPGGGVVTFGTVSPEQAFIHFSSVCFACFVKFWSDCLTAARSGPVDPGARAVLERAIPLLDPLPERPVGVLRGPFSTADQACAALFEAGRLTVAHRLVDSYFGNLSYLLGDTLYISQTASSLDELEGCIDPCPLDGSSSAGVTASSELTAHLGIVEQTGARAILHGHPRFAVALSLDCAEPDCELEGQCHTRCDRERFAGGVPIVPGEVGTGRFGLCHTVPPALPGNRGVIVFGHGVFTVGREDFGEALQGLIDIERACREEVLQRLE
jgi:ribulose-5-phosphate 4-epimerase/fuculose-1-phosphate aldolase